MVRGNGRRSFRGGKSNGGPGPGRGNGGRGGSARPQYGRGRGQYGPNFLQNELDFTLEMYANAPVVQPPATGAPHQVSGKGGRGRGGPGTPGKQSKNTNSGTNTPSRGRGRGGPSYDSHRGRGRVVEGIGAPKKMNGGGPIRPNTTLSHLLYQERPLLRPIVFVPSVHTRVLFQNDDDELLKPVVEDVDDTAESHLPTADRISRVFSAGNIPITSDNEEDEQIDVVDFNDIGSLFNTTGTKSTSTVRKNHQTEPPTIHQVTSAHTKRAQKTSTDGESVTNTIKTTLLPKEATHIIHPGGHLPQDTPPSQDKVDSNNLFYVDSGRGSVPAELGLSGIQPPSLLRDDDDDDVIVYVAPHPRISSQVKEDQAISRPVSNIVNTSLSRPHFSPYVRPLSLPATSSGLQPDPSTLKATDQVLEPIATTLTTSILEPPSFSSVTFSFPKATLDANTTTTVSNGDRLRTPPVTTTRQAKRWKHKAQRAIKRRTNAKTRRTPSFGALGVMREEALLHKIDKERDERYDERRKGDSDLEWGTTDSENVDDEQKMVSEEMDHHMVRVLSMLEKGKAKATERDDHDHGMDVDPDLDMNAMTNFVQGLLGPGAEKHVTMDDLQDQEIMKLEDEEDEEQRGSSGSEDEAADAAMEAEEARLMDEVNVGVGNAVIDDGDEDEDEDETDGESFERRLQRLRAIAGAAESHNGFLEDSTEDDDDDDLFEKYMALVYDDDDKLIQHLNDVLDENEEILTGKDRKHRKKLFDFSFDDMEGSVIPPRRRKDKYKDMPPDLQALWENDRKKKAEKKKARLLEQLLRAADPLTKKKGGKKGRKAMLAAASFDATIDVIPNRVIDMTTLVQQIRRFIGDIGGPSSMSLPPTNKATRKNIHEIALAFGLKSISKGKGDARYTTLIKKTTTGTLVDEAKVGRILRRSGAGGARGDSFYAGGRNYAKMPKQKEGDEVGKAAPKLDKSNVGFRLLASMGWSEGDRIGGSMKGLEAPLSAIIKTSKLGLGAKRE